MKASKFRPSSKRNPCPVCGDSSGKCRDNGDIILCMPFGDTRIGEVLGQYKCIANKGAGWATFKVDNSAEWNEERRREWEAQKRYREQERANEERERLRRSLSPEQRDKGYRVLLAQLTLSEGDRADLLRRGFTLEEIERIGFSSVSPNQKLTSPISPALPGVKPDGWHLAVSGAGYLCPVKSPEGLILGAQIRLENPADGNRYRWLSSPQSAVLSLPNGENPLGYYQLSEKPEKIALVDSLGAKPWLAAKALNAVVIGAAGGQFLSSPQQLLRYLEVATAATKCDQINIYPDAGDVQNRQVMARWKALNSFLNKHKYTVKVAWWGQFTKQDRDIDEGVDPTQIEYLSWEDFEGLIKGKNNEKTPNTTAISVDPAKEKLREMWRKSRQFQGDININCPRLAGNIPDSKPGTITLINSGMGTGKTHNIVHNELPKNKEYGWYSPTHRNNLSRQFCADANFYHYQDELKNDEVLRLLVKDPHSKISSVIDSIIHFSPDDFDNKIIEIDEIESVVQQLLVGSTAVKKWRGKAKKLFAEMLRRCNRTIAMDGNLSESTAKYLAELCPEKRLIKTKNHYKGSCGNNLIFYEGSTNAEGKINKNDRSPFVNHILECGAKEGAFAIGSDSQIFLESIDGILSKAGLKGYRLDSTTCHEDWVKEFLNGADAPKIFIEKYRPDYLLYSPTAENGVNIDIHGYFKNIYLNFVGVIGTNNQLQMMRRVRDTQALIHVVCAVKGFPTQKEAGTPDEIDEASKEYRIDCGLASLEGIDQSEALSKYISSLIELSASPHYKRECELRAVEKYEKDNLRECLKEAITDAGFKVRTETKTRSERAIKRVTEAQEVVKNLVSKVRFEAKEITEEQANELQYNNSSNLNREAKSQIWKQRLFKRLPGIEQATIPATAVESTTEAKAEQAAVITQEFIRKISFDDKQLISRIEDFWFLSNPEITKRLQQERWAKDLAATFAGDDLEVTNYRSRWLKVKKLLDLGIGRFLQPGAEWSNESPDAVAFCEAAKNKRTARAIGYSVGNQTPVQFIGKILHSLGFTTESRRATGGDRERIYKVKSRPLDDPTQAEIFAAVDRREKAKFNQLERIDWDSLAEKAKNELACGQARNPDTVRPEPRPHGAIFSYINKGGCGRMNEESQSEIDNPTDFERIIAAVEKCPSWEEYQQIAGAASREQVNDAWLFIDNEKRREIKLWEAGGSSQPIAIMLAPLVDLSGWEPLKGDLQPVI